MEKTVKLLVPEYIPGNKVLPVLEGSHSLCFAVMLEDISVNFTHISRHVSVEQSLSPRTKIFFWTCSDKQQTTKHIEITNQTCEFLPSTANEFSVYK